jgi:hypothetical protein
VVVVACSGAGGGRVRSGGRCSGVLGITTVAAGSGGGVGAAYGGVGGGVWRQARRHVWRRRRRWRLEVALERRDLEVLSASRRVYLLLR